MPNTHRIWALVQIIGKISNKGEPKCEAIDLENFPTLRNKDLFARISFLKDIHLDESNKDIKAWFIPVTSVTYL